MPRPAATVPRLTPDVHHQSWLGTAIARDVRTKVQDPHCHPCPVAYGDHPSSQLSPPAAAAPIEDPVSMLDQPELTPRVGSIFETKYPTGHRDQKETGTQSNVREELPDQEGFALLDPAPHSHIPSALMSYAPTRLLSPEPLPPAGPCRPRH